MSLVRLAFTVVLLLGCSSLSAFSQATPGILGRVLDRNGHLVPGASVVLSNSLLKIRLQTITRADGSFEFVQTAHARYTLSVTLRAFETRQIYVTVPRAGTIDITLEPELVVAEISVTSNYLAGSEASLSEIPGSIARVDSQVLLSSRVFNFSEALRKVAGVNVRDEEGFGLRPNIGIRGTNPTRSTKVLLLEDGMPLAFAPYGDNASYYHPPVDRYESIEVLKGSGQIAFGPQTVGGVINYLTPNPTAKPTFGIRLTGGKRSYFNGSLSGSGTIAKTGIFASYTRKQGDGARENISSRLNDLSTKVLQTLNHRNALTFKFSYYGEDSNVTYSGATEAEYLANPRANPLRNDFFYGDRFGFSASHTGVFSQRAVLTTNFYANAFSRDWWRQSSNSGQRPNRLSPADPDCRGMIDLNTTCGNEGRLRDYETYGLEPKFTFGYDLGSAVRGELLAGVRVHREVQRRRQENGTAPDSRSGVASEVNFRTNLAYSGFIQNRFLVGGFAITPGIRVEHIAIERKNLLTNTVSIGKTTVNQVIPGIGVAYSGLPRTTVFAGVHRGFSPPRPEDIIGLNGGVIDLQPEVSWNFELGARTAPRTGLRFEGTFFRNDYENQVVPASLAGGVGSVLTNGGETLHQGFEFSGQVDSRAIFDSRHNIYLRSAVTWLTVAEFRGLRLSSITAPATLNLFCPANRRLSASQCDVSGNVLPYAPELLATTSIGYSHPRGFDAFIENVYIGRQFGDDLNATGTLPNGQFGVLGRQMYWNATANYNVERWKTTFFVTAKNLTNGTFIVDRTRGILPSSPRLVQAGFHLRF